MALKLDNSIPKDPYTKQLCSPMCLNSCRQRHTQPHASHKMIPIVEDLLVELLELDDVREHVLEHVLRVLRVVGQLARHAQDVCALPGTNIGGKKKANTFNRMTKNNKLDELLKRCQRELSQC